MILDITGIDIGALVAGIGGLLKSLHSDRTAASASAGPFVVVAAPGFSYGNTLISGADYPATIVRATLGFSFF